MPGRRMTAVLLVLVVVLIIVALIRATADAPIFRAADHATYRECMAAIPAAWSTNSLEREGAERACAHQEQQRRGR